MAGSAFDTGISASYKVPRFIGKIIFGAGTVTASSVKLLCLLVGMRTSSGNLVVDSEIRDCTSIEDADTAAGAGSQLARMAYQALQVPSVSVKLAAVTEATGTVATATIALTGTLTSAGTATWRIAGKTYTYGFLSTDTIDAIGAAIAAKMNADTRAPVTCAYNSGTDTLTFSCKNKGTQGKDWILYWIPDTSGLVGTLTGSAAVNTYGARLGASSSGTGSVDVTTLLTKLLSKRYARIALGDNDTTNAALWETHVNTKAGAISMLYDQLVFGYNGTYANAVSLAQTTLNAQRAQVLWMRNSESHPSEIAAYVAAYRAVDEQANWVPDHDGLELPTIAPQAYDADVPTDTEQDLALNNGVTPLTTVNGVAKIVRSITTYCLNGSSQDERCLDIGDAVMPDNAMVDIALEYSTEFRPQNPYVGPDPAEGAEAPPSGVAYPKLWNSTLLSKLKEYYAAGWLESPPTGIYAPISTYVAANKAIACEVPLNVRRVQHRMDTVVRQIAS